METMEGTNKMLYRLSGVSLLLGGALGALAQLIHPADPQGPADWPQYAQAGQPLHLMLYFAVMLVLLGLPGMYARQSDKTGLAGLAGFLLLFFGLPFVDLIHSVINFSILPSVVAQAPDQAMDVINAAIADPAWAILQSLGFPLLGLGVIITGITTIRARVFPRWTGWLILSPPVVGILSMFLPLPPTVGTSFDGVVLYLALAGFGYGLMTSQRATP